MSCNFRYARFRHNVTNLGPGMRTVIWTQGCERNCKNCIGTNYREMLGGTIISPDEFVIRLTDSSDFSPEITISGGEPFLQAEALSRILSVLKKEYDIGVIAYTGYTFGELEKKSKADIYVDMLLSAIDLLIDGPYIEELDENEVFRGSKNQNLVHLSDRYKTDEMELFMIKKRGAYIDISSNEMAMTGIPTKSDMYRWKKLVNIAGSALDR